MKRTTPFGSLRILRLVFMIIAWLVILYGVVSIYNIETKKRALKEDLVEISNIKYGLFSTDQWKDITTAIVTKKVNELTFTPKQQADMREQISDFLLKTITEFESRYKEEKSQSVIGTLEKGVANLTGIFDKLKRDVPVFTEQVMGFIQYEESREKINALMLEKLDEYSDQTFSDLDYTLYNDILSHYAFGDQIQTTLGIQNEISSLVRQSRFYTVLVFSLILLTGLLVLLTTFQNGTSLIFFTLISLTLLAAGLFLPMMEIDARIAEICFTLFGEPIVFQDQILYYKSKSIIEVVHLLLTQGKLDVIFVGFLLLVFSVIFPVSKLIASMLYIRNTGLRENKLIRFLVYHTGKWSMADVMVVAIFMAYIGFSSILTEQLRKLEDNSPELSLITSNESSLQIGYFLFLAFVLLSMLATYKLPVNKNSLTSDEKKGHAA